MLAQPVANQFRSTGINRLRTLLNVLHDPLFVHHIGGAHGTPYGLVQDAVLLADFSLEIAQQRESKPQLLGKPLVIGSGIHADADYLYVGTFEISDISLIRF